VPDRPRLLLLDGHSLAYRAFYALPVENFSTSTGQPTNAVYGFTSMLINALRDETPTHLAVAFDVSRATFRSEEFPEYKANRSTSPDAFKGQVSLILDVLRALNVPALQVEGYEADDIIATLTEQAESRGIDVAIITGDRDAFQLVTDDVTVLYPKRGVSDLDRMTPAAVSARYGLTPAQYPDYAALRGDPSDNLPGIPGVGEKTAAKWVREFGSLADLLSRSDEVKGKAGEALREHLDQVQRNRRLTELVRDVPLPIDVDALRCQSWDRDAVHEVFDALQFRVLRDRLYQTLETPEPEAESGFELDVEHLTGDTLPAWLSEHADGPEPVGFAVAGSWTRGGGDVSGLAWASPDGATAWIDPTGLDSTAEPVLAAWLADPGRPKVMHHAKGPMLALRAHGWALAGIAIDTELATYLIRPDQRSYDLADLVLRNLHRELRSESADDGQLTLGGEPEETAAVDLGLQARAVLDLAEVVSGELARSGGDPLMRDVEIPLEHVLVDMELAGVGVDVEYLDELRSHFADEVKAAAQAAYAEIGREVNLGSPKQLQVVLFDELGLPKTKRIKTGYTTDADALQGLYVQTEHPFLQHLLRHRDAAKLLVTVE
jgi:DNA polymerase-1